MNKFIEIVDLTVSYDAHTVLDALSFDIFKGNYIGLVGANGSGKTTLVKALLGLVPYRGTIRFSEGNARLGAIRKGYLPQVAITGDKLFPAEVREIVGMGLLGSKKRPKRMNKEDGRRIDAILERLEILSLRHKRIGDLSGGQQQRVLLARAMVSNPDLLILDEPTSALDPKVRGDFYTLINDINRTEGTTIILVSHDVQSVLNNATSIMVLDREILFYGPVAEYIQTEAHIHV